MKNIKILFFISTLAFFIQCEPVENNEIQASMLAVNQEYGPGQISPETGGFVTVQHANEKLTIMLEKRAKLLSAGRTDESVYGYVFGLEKMKEFLKRAEALNQDGRSGDEIITGIRIYNAYGTSQIDGRSKEHKDVFLIPVTKNGDDYINVHEIDNSSSRTLTETVILNISNPCPDQCSI